MKIHEHRHFHRKGKEYYAHEHKHKHTLDDLAEYTGVEHSWDGKIIEWNDDMFTPLHDTHKHKEEK